ncbi:MoaD/ThiS family protein [Altererythrobacter sp. HHU K3-1]|uniref:MoaD/ThiS family protein n=2 Tax=Qipengyuania atrilutea TaxID=2744473 RepID=A0A850H0Z5_9SPHN|nr:MoaD/ThiS family protein [Actirhodobacter atriluteus]
MNDTAEVAGPLDWNSLLAAVPEAVAAQLGEERVHIAVNGAVLTDRCSLTAQDGDEIALLPPVSGG